MWIVGSGMPVDCLYFYGCGLICTSMAVDFFKVCLWIVCIGKPAHFLDWYCCYLFFISKSVNCLYLNSCGLFGLA
jgi:hypothetical protein